MSELSGMTTDTLLDVLADRIAERVAARMAAAPVTARPAGEVWLDTGAAAEHLGIHRDTLRKLAAQGRIPYEQEGPGCKLYFRRSTLDQMRTGGFHAASIAA